MTDKFTSLATQAIVVAACLGLGAAIGRWCGDEGALSPLSRRHRRFINGTPKGPDPFGGCRQKAEQKRRKQEPRAASLEEGLWPLTAVHASGVSDLCPAFR